jgi:glycogen synthase
LFITVKPAFKAAPFTATTSTTPHGQRLAMLFPWDSRDPAVVSGTAFGLATAMEELGVDLVRVEGRPPHRALGLIARETKVRWMLTERLAPDTWRSGIEPTLARSIVAGLRLRYREPVDGIVQLASDFLVRHRRAPLVTYDDMTIRQAIAAGYPSWQLAKRDLAWRIARQQAAYQGARACCTRSAYAAASIHSDYGIEKDKIKVVGVGRNREVEPQSGKSWAVPTFLIVAADWERKNGPALLEAFTELRGRWPEARLHVVGRHPRIDVPGVQAHGYLGHSAPEKARLDALFATSTCFVMPSLHEPLGISYAEAGAAGIPSIGTVNGGAREIIGPGGTVVDPADPAQLLAAMERFADPVEAATVGERARRHSELYTWPRVAKRILAALGLLDPREDPEAAFLPGPG